MNEYLFLISWVDDSPSSGFLNTNVYQPGDLFSEFMKDNESVFAFCVRAPNVELARMICESRCFKENLTEEDSVSHIQRMGTFFDMSGEDIKLLAERLKSVDVLKCPSFDKALDRKR